MSASKRLPNATVQVSRYAADDDWVPSSQDLYYMYTNLSNERSGSYDYLSLFEPQKIGRKTFSEGKLDRILLYACQFGNIEIVSYLLKIFTKHFSIDSLIMKHANFQANRFVELLFDKVSLLHSAAEGAKVDVVKLLLSAGAEVNNQSSWSITPLISTLPSSSPILPFAWKTTLTCLIDSGANVHYRDADGLTPLMYAAKRRCLHAVELLLQAGADPYAMDKEGCTALHYACQVRCVAVIKHLLDIAPPLILLQGKQYSTYAAPYNAANFQSCTSENQSAYEAVMQLFLGDPNCPPEMKVDLKLLKVVSQVTIRKPITNRSPDIDRMVQLVESAIAMRINSNLAAPVSNPVPAYGNYPELAVSEEMKPLDPVSPLCEQQLVLQSLVTAERCFGYASIPIMQMLFHACLDRSKPECLNTVALPLALRLSQMLLFRLQNIQSLTRTSMSTVISISSKFIHAAPLNTTHVLLDTAISIFIALVHSVQRVSTSCMYGIHVALYSSSQVIFDSLASADISGETTNMIMKFTSNSSLLVNCRTGCPESMIHIVLSRSRMLSLPVLETFLKCCDHRWINTPGSNGWRPLHFGSTKEVASLLVDYGAHLDAVDAKGLIPKYSNEYYKSHPRPLSCIVARFIIKTGGIMEHEADLLPTHVRAFISLHDSHATRAQIDGQAAECY